MRPTPRLVVASILVSCAVSLVGAQDKTEKPAEKKEERPPSPKLPFNPYALAKTGDWTVFLATSVGKVGEEKKEQTLVGIFRVTKVTDDQVTLSTELKASEGPERKPKDETYSRKEGLTLADYFTLTAKDELSDVKIEDDEKTVGGKKLACTKVTFTTKRTVPLKTTETLVMTHKNVVWLSKDVGCTGLVSTTIETTSTGGGSGPTENKVQLEIVGYGNGDKATWGKKPEEVELPKAKKDEPK